MKIKPGDFVRFMDENQEGHVSRLMEDNMVGVIIEDDFEIPVHSSNLIVINQQTSQVEGADAEPVQQTQKMITSGLFVAVCKNEKLATLMDVYLVNPTSFKLLATLHAVKDKKLQGLFAGEIASGQAVKIHSLSTTEEQAWPLLSISCLCFSEQVHDKKNVLEKSFGFKGKDFIKTPQNIEILNKNGFKWPVEDEIVEIDTEKLKESFFESYQEKADVENPGKVIDLHIEELRDDHHFMSKEEKLREQISFFQRSIENAIVHKAESIVFIHGVGKGKLKEALQRRLRDYPQVESFKEADTSRYGFGATEICFKAK